MATEGLAGKPPPGDRPPHPPCSSVLVKKTARKRGLRHSTIPPPSPRRRAIHSFDELQAGWRDGFPLLRRPPGSREDRCLHRPRALLLGVREAERSPPSGHPPIPDSLRRVATMAGSDDAAGHAGAAPDSTEQPQAHGTETACSQADGFVVTASRVPLFSWGSGSAPSLPSVDSQEEQMSVGAAAVRAERGVPLGTPARPHHADHAADFGVPRCVGCRLGSGQLQVSCAVKDVRHKGCKRAWVLADASHVRPWKVVHHVCYVEHI